MVLLLAVAGGSIDSRYAIIDPPCLCYFFEGMSNCFFGYCSDFSKFLAFCYGEGQLSIVSDYHTDLVLTKL